MGLSDLDSKFSRLIFDTTYICIYNVCMMSNEHTPKQNEGKEKMVVKAIYFEPSIWQQAKRKAGLMPLAAVIRRLVQLWLEGKINLENYKD